MHCFVFCFVFGDDLVFGWAPFHRCLAFYHATPSPLNLPCSLSVSWPLTPTGSFPFLNNNLFDLSMSLNYPSKLIHSLWFLLLLSFTRHSLWCAPSLNTRKKRGHHCIRAGLISVLRLARDRRLYGSQKHVRELASGLYPSDPQTTAGTQTHEPSDSHK